MDEALSQACSALQARVGELRYDVVSSDDGQVEIRAELDPVAILGLFFAETFSAGGLKIQVHLEHQEEVLSGELTGTDLGLLTASGGRGLDALQYLSNRVLNRRLQQHAPVHLDCGGFKERRAEQLEEQAVAAADEALRRGAPVQMGPLTPAARRVVHLALADDPDVETESDGEGFLKRLFVRPVRRR